MANNQLLASDNFASGSLAAGWSVIPGDTDESAIVSNLAQPAAITNTYGQLWTGLSWPADQICEVTSQTLNATGTNVLNLWVRVSAVGGGNVKQGYLASIVNTSGTKTATIYVRFGGTLTQLGSTVTGLTFTAGDIWAFSASGACIALYQNFKRVFYIGDATIASGGAPGFDQSASSGATNSQVSSWRGYSSIQKDGIWTKQGVIFPATASELATGGQFGTGVSPLQGMLYEGNAQVLSGTVYKSWSRLGTLTESVMLNQQMGPHGQNTILAQQLLSGYSGAGISKIGSTCSIGVRKPVQSVPERCITPQALMALTGLHIP